MQPTRRSLPDLVRHHLKRAMASPLGWRMTAMCWRPPGVAVLMYHRINSPGSIFPGTSLLQFREQMRWLKENCRVIDPEDFDDAVGSSRRRSAKPPVLVTFDDGYRDYHDNAYPVLMDLRISSIVFLATAHVDHGHLIWTELVTYAVRSSPVKKVTLPWDPTRSYLLDGEEARRRMERECKAFLKGVADLDRQGYQAELLAALGIDAAEAGRQRHMMNWNEVRGTMEFTRFGGHTHTHPILSQIDDESVEREVRVCRDRIQAETAFATPYFAYPNGQPSDYNDHTKAVLLRHGYSIAFSTSPGIHQAGMDRLSVPRQPTAARSIGDFASLVAGRH